ncbi:hypothetical protein DIPPA_10788 [Diplonema papillatum]|nr:hypothetical protein DIPPA_10788 [Diplonema papillatum]
MSCAGGRLLILFALLGGVSAQCAAFGTMRRPSAHPGVAKYCPMYADDSCCTELEARMVFEAAYIPFNATIDCAQLVRQTLCHICAPAQNLFYDAGRVTVCHSQCAALYTTCGKARFLEEGKPDMGTAEYGKVLSEAFPTPAALCAWLGYEVAPDQSIGDLTQPTCYRNIWGVSVAS